MRITGGIARSIQLKTLDLPELRPATDQMRQAIFNSIAAYVEGARFLDLFAGCGAYGLEAVSRGASTGVFVERHPKLSKIIAENLAKVLKSIESSRGGAGAQPLTSTPLRAGGVGGGSSISFQIRAADALKFSPEENAFDLVFCDPPYAMIAENWQTLANVARAALKVGGLWLMEHPSGLNLPVPEGFDFRKNIGGGGKNSPNVGIYKKI